MKNSFDVRVLSGFGLTFLIFTISFNSVHGQTNLDTEIFSALKNAAVPLKHRTAGNAFEDLAPLKQTLRDVRIVGLGEATHGTREHFQFKHRLIEYLVRELGFTVFGLEVQYFKCLPINEYVLGASGEKDARKLINRNLSGIYRTEEVLALVEWMHAYNKTVPPDKKVKFYGFDVQTPHQAADFLRIFLKKYDPAYLAKIERILQETAPPDFQKYWIAYSRRPFAQKTLLRQKLLQILGTLTADAARFVRLSSKNEFDTVLQSARILVFSDEVRSTPEKASGTQTDPRDRLMAETVEYILNRETPNAKAILWAHNFHVWNYAPNSNPQTTAALKRHGLGFRPMGNHLKEFFADQYYSLGFVLDTGSFQAIDDEAGDDVIEPQEFTLKPSPVGSFGWYFSKVGVGDFFLDLRKILTRAELSGWLSDPRLLRFAGASFSNKWMETDFTVPLAARDGFDGFVFLANTTRARSLPLDE